MTTKSFYWADKTGISEKGTKRVFGRERFTGALLGFFTWLAMFGLQAIGVHNVFGLLNVLFAFGLAGIFGFALYVKLAKPKYSACSDMFNAFGWFSRFVFLALGCAVIITSGTIWKTFVEHNKTLWETALTGAIALQSVRVVMSVFSSNNARELWAMITEKIWMWDYPKQIVALPVAVVALAEILKYVTSSLPQHPAVVEVLQYAGTASQAIQIKNMIIWIINGGLALYPAMEWMFQLALMLGILMAISGFANTFFFAPILSGKIKRPEASTTVE